MYARLLESDASWNGRFFTGVMTTGIYCLPGCRARKPKPEHVKFFPSCEAARAAGADVNLPDGNGVTPLAHAQRRGYTAIAALLQGAGGR